MQFVTSPRPSYRMKQPTTQLAYKDIIGNSLSGLHASIISRKAEPPHDREFLYMYKYRYMNHTYTHRVKFGGIKWGNTWYIQDMIQTNTK
jgi:hypothetical protein